MFLYKGLLISELMDLIQGVPYLVTDTQRVVHFVMNGGGILIHKGFLV